MVYWYPRYPETGTTCCPSESLKRIDAENVVPRVDVLNCTDTVQLAPGASVFTQLG
jgi:hypothetical protein